MLFQPVVAEGPQPWIKLVDSETRRERAEPDYFLLLREIYNKRNPHAIIGEEDNDGEEE